jgi:hypothetical protein
LDSCFPPAYVATKNCSHAQHNLLGAEWFGHIVVGTSLQAPDPLFHRATGSECNDTCPGPFRFTE